MDIRHRPTPVGGEFLLVENESIRGELTYRREGDEIVVTHTGVDRAFRAQGLGRRLVEAAIAWSRQEGLPISATCWYARQVLDEPPAAPHPAGV